jgi:hypothetical protein
MLEQFVKENTFPNANDYVRIADFVGSFRVWCFQRGHKAPERNAILAELEKLGYSVGQHYTARAAIIGLSFSNKPRYKVVSGRIVKNV